MREKSNKKAQKGTAAHKALELLARKKLALQRGEREVEDEEIGHLFSVDELNVEVAVDEAFSHYRSLNEHHYTDRDFSDVRSWVHTALAWGNGAFDPMRRDVVAPEQFFDLEMPGDWARYQHSVGGRLFEGRLRIHGTVDLVTRVGPRTLEYVDWKTGRRLDWSTGTPKGLAELADDAQLLLYYYALRRLYPGERVLMTVFFINDGGPFTVPFGDRDLTRAEELIRKFYEEVSCVSLPERILPSWKCEKLCHFYSPFDGGVCEQVHQELLELGMDRVTERRADLDRLGVYHGGGGRSGERKSPGGEA